MMFQNYGFSPAPMMYPPQQSYLPPQTQQYSYTSPDGRFQSSHMSSTSDWGSSTSASAAASSGSAFSLNGAQARSAGFDFDAFFGAPSYAGGHGGFFNNVFNGANATAIAGANTGFWGSGANAFAGAGANTGFWGSGANATAIAIAGGQQHCPPTPYYPPPQPPVLPPAPPQRPVLPPAPPQPPASGNMFWVAGDPKYGNASGQLGTIPGGFNVFDPDSKDWNGYNGFKLEGIASRGRGKDVLNGPAHTEYVVNDGSLKFNNNGDVLRNGQVIGNLATTNQSTIDLGSGYRISFFGRDGDPLQDGQRAVGAAQLFTPEGYRVDLERRNPYGDQFYYDIALRAAQGSTIGSNLTGSPINANGMNFGDIFRRA
ncbi:MAG: hypothetical protein ACKO34_09170 [Vampirovibrionales bacterium]